MPTYMGVHSRDAHVYGRTLHGHHRHVPTRLTYVFGAVQSSAPGAPVHSTRRTPPGHRPSLSREGDLAPSIPHAGLYLSPRGMPAPLSRHSVRREGRAQGAGRECPVPSAHGGAAPETCARGRANLVGPARRTMRRGQCRAVLALSATRDTDTKAQR